MASTSMTATKKNKKEQIAFSSEETDSLINLWGKEEALFNCRHEEYFNKDARAAALNRILDGMNKEGKSIMILINFN